MNDDAFDRGPLNPHLIVVPGWSANEAANRILRTDTFGVASFLECFRKWGDDRAWPARCEMIAGHMNAEQRAAAAKFYGALVDALHDKAEGE